MMFGLGSGRLFSKEFPSARERESLPGLSSLPMCRLEPLSLATPRVWNRMANAMANAALLPHDWFPRPLPSNIEIGASSWLYSSFAFLHYASTRDCGVHIGCNSGIYNGTFFDLDTEGEVTIGDYCTVVGAVFSGNIRVSVGNYA